MGEMESTPQGPAESPSPLEVWLTVHPAEGCECTAHEGRTVSQSVAVGPDGSRTSQLLVNDGTGGEATYVATDCDDCCPGAVLAGCECIPRLEEIRDGRLVYAVTIPARATLSRVVERLRDADATVSVTRIRSHSDGDTATPLLTDKQREALETAVEAGYYDRPRGATLEDVADELDITRAAASHRLHSVRRRLIKRHAEQVGAD